MASTFAEACLFCAAAAAAGLLWNALRAGGIPLSESFALAPATAGVNAGEGQTSSLAEIAAREGLQVTGLEDAKEYAKYATDPESGILFLDARKRESYEQGHIPGAVCMDPYRLDEHLTEAVKERLVEAVAVIVYCTGGSCEDSILLGRALVYRHSLVSPELLYLYEGGINEWREQGLPIAK